jgi:peptide alpha-N-acetyltransferase
LHLVHPLRLQTEHKRALDLLEVAFKHTPTLPEIYMAKAMVLKRAGDPLGAAYAMEEARLLDGQDRFLNGKAAKYWLRAGNVAKAEELLALFTKKDTTAVQDLTDMQCLWFLQEEGAAHTRSGALGMALKRYQALVTVFQEYEDDQYDFHSYCMRRMTFSYYLSLLEYEDRLRAHPAFLRTALAAIDIYVRIADDPGLTEEKLTPEEEAERKKAAKKAAKAEAKARKAAQNAGEKKEEGPVPDADPRGDALLKTETPIEDALKLWKPLSIHHARNPATWVAGYALHARSGEFAKALRDLRRAAALDLNAAGLLPALVDFRLRLKDAKLAPEVQGAIDAVLPSLIEGEAKDLAAKRATQGPQGVLDAAKALRIAGDEAGARDTLLRLGETPDIALMREALGVLPKEKATLAAAFHKAAPLAFVFASPEEEKAHEEDLQKLYALPVVEGKADV